VTDHDALAGELLEAYGSGKAVEPLTVRFPELDTDDAYAIQLLQTQRRLAGGARVVGWKVGLTSAPMQQQLGIDQPDFGVLFGDMAYPADAPIPVSRFLQPRAEPEVALVLDRPLTGPGLSVADVLSAVRYALPAIEIIDSRIVDWRIGLVDTIADNASSGGFVLGSTPASLPGIDLALVGCVLRHNGRIAQTGAGAAVLGSPLHAATWLANTLTARGVELEAGQVILTGSVTAAVPVAAGDTVTASLDRLGSVTALFGGPA
jgi:2-keto-4-pentenoate hydratase